MSFPPVFDGHNDVLLRLYKPEPGETRSFFERSKLGHLDMPRAEQGGFAGGFFAVFAPSQVNLDEGDYQSEQGYAVPLPPPLPHDQAVRDAMAMVSILYGLESQSDGRLKVVRDLAELEACLDSGVMAAILHFEGAEAIDEDLHALDIFYRAGLRSLGPVWSRPNRFGQGVPFSFPAGPDIGEGLSEAGKRLVRACNRLGIMLDLSHLNYRGFWDVARLSEAPLVASHSNVHALCNTPRNLLDDQLAAIRESDGLVGLNFAVAFLREDGEREAETSLEVMVRHLDYLIDKLGVDRVAFGSDFDGALIPEAIGDVAGLPALLTCLDANGYDRTTLEKLAYKNWLRVLSASWRA